MKSLIEKHVVVKTEVEPCTNMCRIFYNFNSLSLQVKLDH